MNKRKERVPFPIRIVRNLEICYVNFPNEIPENSGNCHLTSFRTNTANAVEVMDQVMCVHLILDLP